MVSLMIIMLLSNLSLLLGGGWRQGTVAVCSTDSMILTSFGASSSNCLTLPTSSSLPLNVRQHGTYRPPWGKSEECWQFPVTSQTIVPRWKKQAANGWHRTRDMTYCTNRIVVDIMTLNSYGVRIMNVAWLCHRKRSPTALDVQISL